MRNVYHFEISTNVLKILFPSLELVFSMEKKVQDNNDFLFESPQNNRKRGSTFLYLTLHDILI